MAIRRVFFGSLGASLLGIALTAGMCPTEGGEPCESEADCGTEEHCHPTLRVCVQNCEMVDGACDSEPGTECSTEDIITPVNGMAFKGVCTCDPDSDSCPDGEVCNPYDLTCDVPCADDSECDVYEQERFCLDSGGNNFCLLSADDCRNEGVDCGSGEVCDPETGECVAPCSAGSCASGNYCDTSCGGATGACLPTPSACTDDPDCTDDELLCGRDMASECYMVCDDPDAATNTCGASGSRDASGPLIFVEDPAADIEVIAEVDDPGQCTTNGRTPMAVTFAVVDSDADGDYSDTFWLDGASWDATTYFTSYASGYLVVYMCFTSSGDQTRAFYLADNAGNTSNRACVTFPVP